jgi:integrating conjugative element protein (TIGR03761 family)
MQSNKVIDDGKDLGRIEVKVTTVLHTSQAKNLFYGQEADEKTGKPLIVGLVLFAERLKQITFAAHNNDPYADWYLVNVENYIDKTKNIIKTIKDRFNKYSQNQLLEVDLGSSVNPKTFITTFTSVHANMALNILIRADEAIRSILALRGVGFMDTESANIEIDKIVTKIRALFHESTKGYRSTGITRKDVIAKNEKYLAAHTLMKFKEELPDDLIHTKPGSRAKFAPNIKIDFSAENFKGTGRRRKVVKSDENKVEGKDAK